MNQIDFVFLRAALIFLKETEVTEKVFYALK